ncbi:MAG: hypothetical protein ACRD51_05415, partial [Candidatus Acidiferrum sp.]
MQILSQISEKRRDTVLLARLTGPLRTAGMMVMPMNGIAPLLLLEILLKCCEVGLRSRQIACLQVLPQLRDLLRDWV